MKKFISMVVLFSFIVSCASYHSQKEPSLSLDLNSYQNKVINDDVMLLIKPVHLLSDMKSYYDEDVLKYGVLPIQFYVKNASEKNYLLSLEGLNLIDSTGVRIPPLTLDQAYEKLRKSFWRTGGWALATGVFSLFSLHNVNKINGQMKADLSGRMLKGGHLIPGSATEGVLYFNIPKGLSSLSGWKVALVMKDSHDQIININFNLNGNIEKREEPANEKTNDNEDFDS